MSRRGERMEVFLGADNQWHFHHRHANNEKGPWSEPYTRKFDAIKAAHAEQPDLPVYVGDRAGWVQYEGAVLDDDTSPEWDNDNEPENQPDGWSFSEDEPDRDPGM